jgi:hypothetical protein
MRDCNMGRKRKTTFTQILLFMQIFKSSIVFVNLTWLISFSFRVCEDLCMTSLRVSCSVHQILWWRTLESNRIGNRSTIGLSFDMVISTTNTTIITTGSAEYRKTIFDVTISDVTTIFDVIIFDAPLWLPAEPLMQRNLREANASLPGERHKHSHRYSRPRCFRSAVPVVLKPPMSCMRLTVSPPDQYTEEKKETPLHSYTPYYECARSSSDTTPVSLTQPDLSLSVAHV